MPEISFSRNSEHLSHPKYRADIDGLRAVAILSVVGFHAFPNSVKGGFIGVDIFFVISGFLISTIIFSNLERDSFSFIEFYSRRIKRIFPALLLTLIACYAFGWFVLFADEYQQLGKHIAGGAGFISNLVLWKESGYFDNAAETKLLLHLWSLGIEEQFYIIWPLLLWFAWKRRLNLLTITIIVLVISFALNINKVHSDAVAAFYSPQTRFWELLVGAVLAYTTLYKQNIVTKSKNRLDILLGLIIYKQAPEANGNTLRNVQSLLGAALITIGVLVITKEKHFPGWWAVLPTVGAVLIISAGTQAWLNRTVLSNRVLVWFGLISFPLYLWHWPLLSFARIIESEKTSQGIRITAVIISIVFAWLTYKLIEKPIRFGKYSNAKTIVLLVLMIAVGFIGYNTYKRDGLGFRTVATKKSGFDGSWNDLAKECDFINAEESKLFFCRQDLRGEPKYAVLGDSKAGVLAPGLFRTSDAKGRWLVITSGPSPLIPVLSDNTIHRNSPKKNVLSVIDFINKRKNIKTVVIAASTRGLFGLNNDFSIDDLPTNKNYGAAFEGLNNTINMLTESGKKIVLLVDNPTLPHQEDCLQRTTDLKLINHLISRKSNQNCWLNINRYYELSMQYRKLLTELKENHPSKIEIFDTTKYLCDLDQGICSHFKNEHLLYGVSDHISDYSAGLIGKDLNDFLHSQD
jgi:peptidoglycan/LPS O-acetylase OafA/YrhL